MTRPAVPHPPRIAAIVRRLRRQIRRYVWLEGLAVLVTWIGIAFWVGLALDYLPVLGGANEMPRTARAVLLAGVSLVLLYLLYRFILRRAFVRLADRSLALLMERRFPQFQDTLITAVDTSPREPDPAASDLNEAMFRRVVELADERSAGVDTSSIFSYRPLVMKAAAAAVAVVSIVLFGWFARDAFSLGASRLLLLSDAPWPRRAHIEVLDFRNGQRKVAEGSDLTVRVRADATRPTPPPTICTIDFRLANGERGRVNMSRDGEPRDGHQYYRYQGPPFQGMLSTVRFDVVGFDHRVANLRVDVVERPSIVDVQLDCQLPSYLNREPRKFAWRPGTSLPVGTQVTITARATKPLQRVTVDTLETNEQQTLNLTESSDPHIFRLELPCLEASTSIDFELLDRDGARSQNPYRVAINAIEDLAPQVEINLKGIGTAITPQALLPIVGRVRDDYQLREAWFQLDRPSDGATHRVPLNVPASGDVEASLDLRQQRNEGHLTWPLEPGEKVMLTVQASDLFDLGDEPHVGQSDQFPLDIVTPQELLALLEARELNLKRRFEQTIAEVTDTRDSLLRLQASLAEMDQDAERSTDDEERSGETADEAPSTESLSRDSSLRRLRVQRARQEGTKAQQEVQGVAASFADIRAELINNRVDTPERRDRLQQRIIHPLELIVADDFTRWLDQLAQLEPIAGQGGPLGVEATGRVVQQTNDLIVALQEVLESMLELETYNELLDLVRSIIAQQEELMKRTEAERKRQDRSVLEDE